jgi:hypothetical protein
VSAPEIPEKDYAYTEEKAKEMLNAYLTDGPNGTEADEIIENILKYGTCGDQDLDSVVNNHLGTADMRAKVEALAKDYFQNGRSGFPAVDDVLDSDTIRVDIRRGESDDQRRITITNAPAL